MNRPVGVIGSGSFGVTVSTLLSSNVDVLLFTRRASVADAINNNHHYLGYDLNPRVRATNRPEDIAEQCKLIFPVIPSKSFRAVMKTFGPLLNPGHILIHATKGLDWDDSIDQSNGNPFAAKVSTMSDVIRQESTVVRIGAMSGPNLAKEILDGQPAGTVIASEFDEVILAGRKALKSKRFYVFGSHDLKGAELAGAFKNIIAVASGILGGLNLGKNIQALLITRGLSEIIRFGMAMGADKTSYFGISGMGDLVATATSTDSRNYTFGYQLAQNRDKSVQDILAEATEVVEGVRTLKIAHILAEKHKLHLPIINIIYKIIYEDFELNHAIEYLMSYPYTADVDF